jgi:hypothetical protein
MKQGGLEPARFHTPGAAGSIPAPATTPIVREHEGILVVRDDLFPGGTKARFMHLVFDDADEAVYASPAEDGAQAALATVAQRLGKRATIFVAQRARPHARTLEAARVGAKIVPVAPGYLSVVQARAREYCSRTGAALVPFGADMPEAALAIAAAANAIGIEPDEVWCSAGSGVLARGLAMAWPTARRSTSTPRRSAARRRASRRSPATRTTTPRPGNNARPGRVRAACCSGM